MASAAPRLPLEITREIIKLCSRETLPTLARVDRGLQIEAERFLYATIAVRMKHVPQILESLTSSRRRAKCVSFLSVDEGPSRTHYGGPSVVLLKLLPMLISLVDLRLRFKGTASLGNDYSQVLRNCPFKLHTLFCDDWMDIISIVKSQTQLRFLGFRGSAHLPDLTSLLEQLSAANIIIPITFELFIHSPNCIQIHSTYLPSGSDRMICQQLRPVLDKDHVTFMKRTSHTIKEVYISLDSVEDTNYTAEITMDMINSFPNVEHLTFKVSRVSKLNMLDVKGIILPIPNLVELSFLYGGDGDIDDDKYSINLEEKLACAREWNKACPELRIVSFFDRTLLKRDWHQDTY